MKKKKPTVVVGLLGTTLDAKGKQRWNRWRPTVELCRTPGVAVDRFELLYQATYKELLQVVVDDIHAIAPHVEVVPVPVMLPDPWDFEAVYDVLAGYAAARAFDADAVDLLLHITTGTHVAQICMFLLAESRRLPGRLLQTAPARVDVDVDDSGKVSRASRGGRDDQPGPVPLGRAHIIDLDLSRYDRIVSRTKIEAHDGAAFLKAGIATKNQAFNALIAELEVIATRSRAPLLLSGPTGAGKTQLARRVFDLKKQRNLVRGAFVEVNCATIVGDGAMSMLFGHTKGAFTGAVDKRAGLLKAADGGVLFLDEIGELGLDEQAMLLRAIEDKRFLPVGADAEVASDFHLIAGTNRDLVVAVREGRFREDLLARIALWGFALPALRDRREDIDVNVDVELARVAKILGRQASFVGDARAAYLRFATSAEATWRGNFRELAASVERMATLADGRIRPEHVARECDRLRALWARAADIDVDGAGGADDVVDAVFGAAARELDRFDRAQLREVLTVCRASRSLSDAGRTLFAESRKKKTSVNDADRLRKYLATHSLSFDDVRAV
jgi:transcriptional regulatory protein RtcR